MSVIGTKPVYRDRDVEPYVDEVYQINIHPHAKYSEYHYMIEVW